MKRKPHELTLKDFIEWRESAEIVYARSSYENKSLVCTVDGWNIVRCAGSEVYRTKMYEGAIRAYNNITAKYIEPKINFKL